MRYLCLVYVAEATFDSMSPDETAALEAECLAHNQELEVNGQLVGTFELRPAAESRSVRVRNETLSATDGPFAETKEQLGGFFIIEARDLDEATQIAAGSPMARVGTVEIRPEWNLAHRVRDRAA